MDAVKVRFEKRGKAGYEYTEIYEDPTECYATARSGSSGPRDLVSQDIEIREALEIGGGNPGGSSRLPFGWSMIWPI